jgi:hypothetical protein
MNIDAHEYELEAADSKYPAKNKGYTLGYFLIGRKIILNALNIN